MPIGWFTTIRWRRGWTYSSNTRTEDTPHRLTELPTSYSQPFGKSSGISSSIVSTQHHNNVYSATNSTEVLMCDTHNIIISVKLAASNTSQGSWYVNSWYVNSCYVNSWYVKRAGYASTLLLGSFHLIQSSTNQWNKHAFILYLFIKILRQKNSLVIIF